MVIREFEDEMIMEKRNEILELSFEFALRFIRYLNSLQIPLGFKILVALYMVRDLCKLYFQQTLTLLLHQIGDFNICRDNFIYLIATAKNIVGFNRAYTAFWGF